MNEDDVEVEQGFYQSVAQLLQCDSHEYAKFPYGKRTRWNNRLPGNGRFLGHGIVRRFNSDHIFVQLTNPPVCGVFSSADAALRAIAHARENFD